MPEQDPSNVSTSHAMFILKAGHKYFNNDWKHFYRAFYSPNVGGAGSRHGIETLKAAIASGVVRVTRARSQSIKGVEGNEKLEHFL